MSKIKHPFVSVPFDSFTDCDTRILEGHSHVTLTSNCPNCNSSYPLNENILQLTHLGKRGTGEVKCPDCGCVSLMDTRDIKEVTSCRFEDLPLYINSENTLAQGIVKYRLEQEARLINKPFEHIDIDISVKIEVV